MDDDKKAVFGKCDGCGKIVVAGDVVMISRTEYETLVTPEASALPDYRLRSATKIARNREQAEFVIKCLASMTVTEAHDACVSLFGEAAPSRSQVFRFAADMGLRRAARVNSRRY